jgi:heterodisulfide reductase subunit B2
MKYLYYPGCSQKATAKGYEESLLAVCPEFGIELEEMDDWNCCGTTAVISVNKVLALSLAARNLALAESKGLTVVTPCPSCWLSLSKVNKLFHENGPLAEKVKEALAAGGLAYNGTVKVRHLLELLVNEVGPEKIKEKAGAPLTGVKIAPYYGCQLVRPYAEGDSADNPQNLEKLIQAVGGTVADFAMRTNCCGGTLVATREEMGNKMSSDVLRSIHSSGANLIVTPCSLCQTTVEAVQRHSKKLIGEKVCIPVLTITQLIGLAMGKTSEALALDRLLTPKACLKKLREQPAA